MKEKVDIFSYDNYRFLIRDFFVEKRKRLGDRFSYRAFAKEAGFAASHYIQLIIGGKKNISQTGIHGLAEAMQLGKRERDFFENLVHFNQADTPDKKEFYLKRMCSFREFAADHELIEEQYEYFSKWYTVAVRELISLPQFDEGHTWIAKALNAMITPKEAKEAMDLLHRLKLIARDKEGRWQLKEPHLRTSREVHSSMAAQFHSQILDRAKHALSQSPQSREFNAITMCIDDEQFDEVKARASEFWTEILNFLSEKGKGGKRRPNRVCQLNIQLFHLTPFKGKPL